LDASRRRYLDTQLTGVLDDLGRVDDVQSVFAHLMDIATGGRIVKGEVYEPEATVRRFMERQGQRRQRVDTVEGYRTGWQSLDFHLGGLVPKRLTILSGPSGHGKTSVVVNWLANVCVRDGVPGFFASLEMGVDDIEDRLISVLSGNVLAVVKSGVTNAAIYEATEHYKAGALVLSDNHPRDIHDVAFLAERYSRSHGIKVFVLDYVGELVRDQIRQREERDERFARWTKIVRDMAKRLNFHAVIVAQVNYEGMLAESKKMAHIADHYLHFERVGRKHILECRKNRFGPVGYKYEISYDRQTQRMSEVGILSAEEKQTEED
jgi:replicative DNA helicase